MMQTIDSINAKILKDLLKDGRKSFTQIAKECNTSKDVISKRYKQMKSTGIIVGSTVQTSLNCYGDSLAASIYLKIQPKKKHQVLDLAHKISHFLYAYEMGTSPDLTILVTLKKIEELEEIKQSIKKLPFILGFDITVWLGIRTSPENLSILSSANNLFLEKKERIPNKRKIEIDKLSSEIIDKLATNGRMPFAKIAKELNVSTDTISKRYTKLEENKDLKVVIQIDPTKIGYNAFAIFNLTFSHENLPDHMIELAKIPDVNFLIKTSGNFDFMLSLMISSIQQLIAVQEQITSMPGLTHLQINVSKSLTGWPTPREFISTF